MQPLRNYGVINEMSSVTVHLMNAEDHCNESNLSFSSLAYRPSLIQIHYIMPI